ncbi:MAG TPA: iron-containing redox enzyme family protein [Kofleriaceae bacterium]|nr:iron-containing redox enzyme family protein [Kofleriaceae bacterium]
MQEHQPELRARIDTLLNHFIKRFYAESPAARHLREAASVDLEMFKGHTVQTILRIRLARMADAKALLLFAKSDPIAAQRWAKYAEEEMLHDKLFLKDLKKLGMEEAAIYATEPFLATKLLQGYLYYTLEHEGPMGLIAKAYFLEYTSRATQSEWNANIRKSLGPDAVRGADAHINIDIGEDHSTDVWNVLASLVNGPKDEARLEAHIHTFFGLFSAYFADLARVPTGASAGLMQTPIDAVRSSATPPAVS